MSGRYTFTAGNNLTAAQINTNIMDGIPYKIVAGKATVTGSLAITWASSFTSGVEPIVTLGLGSAAGATGSSVTCSAPSTNTGVTVYVWQGTTASSTAKTVYYTALQMTSSTGAGNS
jgi:hypothetical protein